MKKIATLSDQPNQNTLMNWAAERRNRLNASHYLPFDKDEIEGSIIDRWQSIVAQIPQQIAIQTADCMLTYTELDTLSAQIAQAILTEDRQSGLVALLFEQGTEPLVAILGTLKAGYGYVALDVELPPAQLAEQLEDSLASIVVTAQRYIALAEQIGNTRHRIVEYESAVASEVSTEFVPVPLTGKSLLSVVYTSGSTGKSKGIARSHAYNLHYAWSHATMRLISASDRVPLVFNWSYAFGSILSFATWLNGATLYPINLKESPSFLHWVGQNRITFLPIPISLFRSLLSDDGHDPATYQQVGTTATTIMLSGQALLWEECEQFIEKFHCFETLFQHTLGSSEAGTLAIYYFQHPIGGKRGKIPLGYPSFDKEILILDHDHQALPQGEVGEIVIRSRYLVDGYWRQPELTASKFLPDPDGPPDSKLFFSGDMGRFNADGMLEFVGRKDEMVKVRGYRVELSAIEIALRQLDCVTDAAVIAPELPNGERRLVAYIVTSDPPPSQREMMQQLAQRVANYAMPNQFVFMDALPLLPSGKIDRQGLPVPSSARPSIDTPFLAPRNAIESQLAAIWEELLDIHPIGVQDDFFDLGGHSIALMNLLSQIKAQFGQEIAIATFLQEPTIEKIALKLQGAADSEESTGVSTAKEPMVRKVNAESRELVERYLSGQAIKLREATLKQRLLDYLPFESRVKLFTLFCQRDFVQKRFFRQEREIISRFLEATELEEHNPSDVIATHLMRLLCRRFCRGVLSRSLLHDFDAYVSISGQEIFSKACQKGQGVILVSIHCPFVPGVLPIILKHLGHDDLILVVGKAVLKQNPTLFRALQEHFGDEQEATVTAKFMTGQFHAAQRTLKQGGIVWIIADGASGGASSITLPVLGRLRPFKTGFAELALKTGATVIPMSASIERTGLVTLSFLPPLDAGEPAMPLELRVSSLVTQYVAFLEESWRRDPANIGTEQIRWYFT